MKLTAVLLAMAIGMTCHAQQLEIYFENALKKAGEGDLEAAERLFTKALRKDKTRQEIWFNRGVGSLPAPGAL